MALFNHAVTWLTEKLDLVAEADKDLDVAALWAAVEETVPRYRGGRRGRDRGGPGAPGRPVGRGGDAGEADPAPQHGAPVPVAAGQVGCAGAAPAGRRILTAVRRLPTLSRRWVMDRPLMPREIHADSVSWMPRRAVLACAKLSQGAVDRGAYAVRVLKRPHRALNRRDVFAPSNRWAHAAVRRSTVPLCDPIASRGRDGALLVGRAHRVR
ncbi:hypothetical protein ACIBJF_41995 [Streptomyces sp. NPDC050743]|uniref:hypothetical protein n=1 Tax=Streptomyces sp. NPDC050743 TaxID=3365634 RepID=UPI0037B93BC8